MFFHYISHPQRFCVCKFRVLRFVFYHIYRKKSTPYAYAGQEYSEPRQNADIYALFAKLSLEVRIVRRRSTLPKIIENSSVLVAGKSCAHVFR